MDIIKIAKEAQASYKELILTKQLIRSGTSIGAMVRETKHAESIKDFIHKMSIGLKEANETRYWLDLLFRSDYLNEATYNSIYEEII